MVSLKKSGFDMFGLSRGALVKFHLQCLTCKLTDAHTGPPHIQSVNDLNQKILHEAPVVLADAATSVHDEHHVDLAWASCVGRK